MGELLMDNEKVTLQKQEVYTVINTLKKIRPDGFKSMDRVVGLVMFFENKLNQQPEPTEHTAEVTDDGIS